MTEFKHQAVSVGYAIEPLNVGDMVETYTRSWRERLLSWPWRPWMRTAVRKSTLARMMELNQPAVEEMRRVTGTSSVLLKD
jgi:hypothetical protein